MDTEEGMDQDLDGSSAFLPEDDSVFQDISNREDNVSSDALMESSFDESVLQSTSTPAKNRKNVRGLSQCPPVPPASFSDSAALPARRVTRSQLPGPSALPVSSPTRRITRSQSPGLEMSPLRRVTRSMSPGPPPLNVSSSSPSRRATRSQSPRPPPLLGSDPSSPSRRVTRSQSPVATAVNVPAPASASSSSPRGGRGRGRSHSSSGTSKDTRMKCPKCPSTLANKKTLDTHLRGHLITGVTARLPSGPDLSQAMSCLLGKVLDEFLKETVIGELDEKVHEYAEAIRNKLDDTTGALDELCSILSDSFHDIMRAKKIIFPSALRTNVYIGTNKLLSTSDFKDSVVDKFQLLEEGEEKVLNVFFGNVIFRLSKVVLVHSVKIMRGATEEEINNRMTGSSDRLNSRNFQELVFHIGGSIVAGFIYKGEGYSNTSTTWAAYTNVLKANFRCDKNRQKQCSEEVRHWTEARDRGGLTYITDAAFDFFLITFDLIIQQEGRDGSLPRSVVDEKVLGDDVVLLLWDVLAGNELDCDKSIDLLAQIIQTCVRVVMKGILKRRLNSHLKRAFASIALRAKLVPDNAKS